MGLCNTEAFSSLLAELGKVIDVIRSVFQLPKSFFFDFLKKFLRILRLACFQHCAPSEVVCLGALPFGRSRCILEGLLGGIALAQLLVFSAQAILNSRRTILARGLADLLVDRVILRRADVQ